MEHRVETNIELNTELKHRDGTQSWNTELEHRVGTQSRNTELEHRVETLKVNNIWFGLKVVSV